MIKKLSLAAIFAALVFINLATFSETGLAVTQDRGSQLWQKIDETKIPVRSSRRLFPTKYQTFSLNQKALLDSLASLPPEFGAAREKLTIIEIPLPDGTISRFRIEESRVLSDELSRSFPAWKTFQGFGIDDPSATARFDWTSKGFHGYIFTTKGTVYIDPFQESETQHYLVYYKHDYLDAAGNFSCKTEDSLREMIEPIADSAPAAPAFTYGTNIRTYRLAVATTGEWARGTANGSTDPQTVRTAALAALTTSINRLDGIYRREISSSFQLVDPPITNDATNIIFDNPATDPYDNTDSVAQLTLNQTTLDARVGAGNYDIGHLYGTGGGGVASSPSVCSTSKAEGYSARAGFYGDPFTVDYVSHELGHQFGASHTYNNMDNGGACTTRSTANAFEVASGSTIMSYVGICNIRNLQQYVDVGVPAFHIRSLTEMTNYLATPDGTCGTTSGTNAIPTVSAGASFTIPRLTPFTLTATGNDADAGDVPNLQYSWEEYDLAPSGTGQLGTPALGFDVDTDGVQRPLFRAYSPVSSPTRTFPSLTFILNPANNAPAGSNNPPLQYQGTSPTGAPGAVCQAGNDCVVGENLPSIARTMNFRVAIRDGRGGIADTGTTVTTAANTGPFQVTAQNDPIAWAAGSTQNVTWDVAGTNAAPINAANVKISLSTDGGLTFPTVLAASTPNTGTASITVPNSATTQGRIKVEAVGNIFFDINNANFQITAAGAGPGASVADGSAHGGRPPQLGNSGTNSPADTSVPFVITLSAPSNQTVTLTMSTHGITATEGFDFVSEDGLQVVFPPNTTTQTVNVPIVHNPGHQPDETFALDIVTASGATIVDGEGIGTIIDDDPAGGIESDLAPRPNGNGTLEPGDVVIVRQAVVGSITLDPATNEFQRADSAPGATGGDGQLDATDIIQTRRYVVGIDPPQVAAGPISRGTNVPVRNSVVGRGSGRVLSIGSAISSAGRSVSIPVDLDAKGDEAATSFALNFDPSVLQHPRVDLAAGAAAGTSLTVNTADAKNGVISVALDTTSVLSSHLITVTFDVAAAATPGDSAIGFAADSACISNDAAQSLVTATRNGVVTIARSPKFEVSGRIFDTNGRGLRNAQVTLTATDGTIQTNVTSSFGYYRFAGLDTGGTYTITVATRQFRFVPRVIQIAGDAAEVDITAIQ